MEILGIYAIRDKKSERFDTPFFAVSDLFAKRRYLLMVDEEGSVLAKWTDEFELHKLGTISVLSGEIEIEKKVVMFGNEIKKEK